jgi:hypothetical protein
MPANGISIKCIRGFGLFAGEKKLDTLDTDTIPPACLSPRAYVSAPSYTSWHPEHGLPQGRTYRTFDLVLQRHYTMARLPCQSCFTWQICDEGRGTEDEGQYPEGHRLTKDYFPAEYIRLASLVLRLVARVGFLLRSTPTCQTRIKRGLNFRRHHGRLSMSGCFLPIWRPLKFTAGYAACRGWPSGSSFSFAVSHSLIR